MEYGPKWLNDVLGIKRSTLRVYESSGLIPRKGARRSYTKEEVDEIWTIKVLTGIGFSHADIKKMRNGEDFDFRGVLAEKLEQLFQQKRDIERSIEYVDLIKTTGRVPLYPSQGIMKAKEFEDFAKKSLIDDDVGDQVYKRKERQAPAQANHEPDDSNSEDERFACMVAVGALTSLLAKHSELKPEDPHVQAIVGVMYEAMREAHPLASRQLDRGAFARVMIALFAGGGDATAYHEEKYGKDTCKFMAEAVALYSGFSDVDSVYGNSQLDIE